MSNRTLLIGWPKKNARRFRSRKVLWAISFFFGRAFFHRCFHRNFKRAIFLFCLDPHSKLLLTLSPTRFFHALRRVLRPLYVPVGFASATVRSLASRQIVSLTRSRDAGSNRGDGGDKNSNLSHRRSRCREFSDWYISSSIPAMYLCGAHQCRGHYFVIAPWTISANPYTFLRPGLID